MSDPLLVHFSCELCSEPLAVPASLSGSETACRKCGTQLTVPQVSRGMAVSREAEGVAPPVSIRNIGKGLAFGIALVLIVIGFAAGWSGYTTAHPKDGNLIVALGSGLLGALALLLLPVLILEVKSWEGGGSLLGILWQLFKRRN